MSDTAVAALPPEVSPSLDGFRDSLKAAAGDNLVALVVYGSAARGRYDRELSDVNVVVVLRDASGDAVAAIAPVLHEAQRSIRVEPMIVAEHELARLAVTFPTKILDIQRRHVTLHGPELFDGITVSREHVRLRAEQELRNLALRLRLRFVAARLDAQALGAIADDAAATLAVNLRALLFLKGKVGSEFQPALAIYESAASEFDLDAPVLAATKRIHSKEADRSMSAAEFSRLIDTVTRAADLAASMV